MKYDPSIFDTLGFPMEQHPQEIRDFVAALPELTTVVEIGVRHGGTSALWAALGAARVVSVDAALPAFHGLGLKAANGVLGRLVSRYAAIRPVIGDSHALTTLKAVEAALAGVPAVDLLFIDGDHTAAGVWADVRDYFSLVRPGGWIAFHDIVDTALTRQVNCRVCEVWEEIKRTERGHFHEFCVHGEWGGIGAWETPCV